MPPKRICVLGSTGSIGENTLRVIGDFPERFEVVGLAAHGSAERLAEQARQFRPGHVCLVSPRPLELPEGTQRLHGQHGLCELIESCAPDLVVVATVGYAGLAPTLRAIELGITVALANKEVLVAAGELVMEAARQQGVLILPIDSEHNAIFQCLAGRRERGLAEAAEARETPIRRLILTASGGPFRGRGRAELATVSVEQALAHPTWQMGAKITIDSATLMNKGFEVMETFHLFGEPAEKIEVVIHPQSVIHGLIEYQDGSMLAQMGVTNMYLPIMNILAYPERLENRRFEPMNLYALGTMTFEQPDPEAFPCLPYAYAALAAGGTAGAVLNAANEIAVKLFLEGQLGFLGIAEMIDAALQAHRHEPQAGLEAIRAADAWARHWCLERAGCPAVAGTPA